MISDLTSTTREAEDLNTQDTGTFWKKIVVGIRPFGAALVRVLWLQLPITLADLIAVLATYAATILVVRGAELAARAVWSAGVNPFYAPIGIVLGRQVTPALILRGLPQWWLVASIAAALAMAAHRMVRLGRMSRESSE